MQLYDLPARSQTLNRLVSEGSALSDVELLAIFLDISSSKKSSDRLAKQLLENRTLTELLELDASELVKNKGLSLSQAQALKALHQLSKLISTKELTPVTTPSMVAGMLAHMANYTQEHFVALYLNARHQLIKQQEISLGVVNSTQVDAREAFLPGLESRAVGVIFAHNHPSNTPEPSEADIQVTRRLTQAGEILGISVLDHLVIAQRGYVSLRERQLI